jgi:hypothetical protein
MTFQRTLMIAITFLAVGRLVAPLRGECPTLALKDEFKRSDTVFVGRAVAQSIVPTPPSSMVRATETTFEIERIWKGEPTKTVRVLTCGGTVGDESVTCSESLTFALGARYVVFADGRPLTTDSCHHTALVERADATLQWLAENRSR